MFVTIGVTRMRGRVKIGGSILANGLTERLGIDWRRHRLHPDRMGHVGSHRPIHASGQSCLDGLLPVLSGIQRSWVKWPSPSTQICRRTVFSTFVGFSGRWVHRRQR